ncbi:MAG: glutathione-dependent reductase [Rhodospirillaceae bacterium]|nr:glutathione-dependent reductase [Rhodospirillaceae bacterium]OUT76968.1 MAG: glutathione-dependent reductase [Rhodospirillaceae bacterium TMED23]|tara:strand:- start:30552 stop:31535 length:984 start_codon:yes stop_codon:yes gene_type:complete
MGLLVDGHWSDDDNIRNEEGKFIRPESSFRNWITSDGGPGPTGELGFAAEAGRYHLYITHNCPWAYRTAMFRRVKGLEDIISISIGGASFKDQGWTFNEEPGALPDAVNNIYYLHELYTKADPKYTGRVTVPVLWDKKSETIVNNESSEIIRMFNSAFDKITHNKLDFYPESLRNQIDEINAIVYKNINNGVYRAGFATTQNAYEEAYNNLFMTLDKLEERLGERRYLTGEKLTEADWRLFSTLIRFDVVYYTHFKCNKRHIFDYPNLWNFTLELYQYPGISSLTNFEHIKRGYYGLMPKINPSEIVAKGPDIDFNQPHDRGKFAIS